MRKRLAAISAMCLLALVGCSGSDTSTGGSGNVASTDAGGSTASSVPASEMCDGDAVIADLNRFKTYYSAQSEGTSVAEQITPYASAEGSSGMTEQMIRKIIALSCDTPVGEGVSAYYLNNDAQCADSSLSDQTRAERGVVCYESPGDVVISGTPWNEGMLTIPTKVFIYVSANACSGAAETMIQADLVPDMGIDEGTARNVLGSIHDVYCPDLPF